MDDYGEHIKDYAAPAPELFHLLDKTMYDYTCKYFPRIFRGEELPQHMFDHDKKIERTAYEITVHLSNMCGRITEMRQEKNKRKKEKIKTQLLSMPIWFADILYKQATAWSMGESAWQHARSLYKKAIRIVEKHYPLLLRTHEYHRDYIYSNIRTHILALTIKHSAYDYFLLRERLERRKKKR